MEDVPFRSAGRGAIVPTDPISLMRPSILPCSAGRRHRAGRGYVNELKACAAAPASRVPAWEHRYVASR